MSAKHFLNNLIIPKPCDADWDSMIGTDQMRFCQHCNLDVHNISLMTRSQAERLIARSNGRLCVRYHSNQKGQPLTLPVSQKLHHIRRLSRIAAGAFTATLSVSSAVAQQPSRIQLRNGHTEATEPVARWALNASISGTIKDSGGATVSGATVSLWSEKFPSGLFASANMSGEFKVENLSADVYQVRVEAPGFGAYESRTYAQENQEARLEVFLQRPTLGEAELETVITSLGFSGGAIAFNPPEDPFIRAAQENDLETLAAMISGMDVNRRDKQSETTALEHAVRNANREMVQLLLTAGADVNAKNASGETVLMMIDADATADLTWDLLNAGADVNMKDDEKNTALMRAASLNNLEALKVLLEAGADINAENDEGLTPLMQASAEGHVNVVRALVLAGCDMNAVNKEGANALSMAKENDRAAVVRFLKSKGAAEVVAKSEQQE